MSKPHAPNKEISGQIEKSELLERLKAWAAFLSEIDQEEDKTELDQICASLVSPDLLEYQDADVKLFVACCAADVLRIYAPEAPYADEQLKEIFMMFVEQLRGLEDIEGKSFKRYFYLLENLACVKTFILCMELDAPDIILSLFRTFFQIFNDRHVGKVQTFMVDIMMTVMQEGDSIPQDVMDIILMHIIQPYKSRKPAAHRLAKELINKSAAYMEPNIQKFFNAALMKGLETDSGLHSRVYDLIKELNRVCPSILLAVLPQLQEKLKSADVNERLEVTRLLAEMFSDKGSELASQNKQLWNCFLRRFNDIEAAVRAECVSTCKNFILNHLTLSDDCYTNLCKRHRDPDEKVRLEAVKVVYAIASEDITRMTPELFLILQERMLDKKWPIRHQAIMNVARLYKEINNKKDPSKIRQVAWMPNKVLHTYYQNTSQDRLLVERLLLSCLVPVSLGAKDRMNILLRTYCLLDAAAIKALNELLRYQQTIRMHLAALLKAIEQGIGEEDRKKLLNQVSMLSKSLPDSKTANSDLKRLSNTLVHDRSLLKAFQTIVTPGVSCQQVARAVSEIMKKLTNKNPIMDTIRALMDRTAPVLADSTCITVLVNITSQLLSAPTHADSEDEDKFNIFINGQKGLHLILSLATVYPGQFKAQEVFEQLLVNLKNADDEVVLMDLKILSKTANGLDRRHPSVASCLQPQLIKLAKEGTPSQAKQAIQVIHGVYQDSPKVLEHLMESIVGLLDADHPNLPSIVKAVAQIAKVAPKIFEEFSRDIVRDFLLSEILTQDREEEEGLVEDDYWCEEDELSKDARVKIEGVHVMVNWVSRTAGDKTMISTPVLKLLWALLQQKGDMNGNSELRLCSMSHLRLHAGLCVLKLAGEPSCFDLIPLELFQEVAWLIQDPCPQVKQAMLNKLQKGLTSMKLPLEYVALLAFYATDVGKERRSKARQILLRVIQLRRDYMVMNSSNSERNHTVLPEYALPTLVHLLAHHPNMDIERKDSLKSTLDVLWWFLEPLMQKNDNFPFLKKLVETVKQAVDAIDPFNDTLNEQIYAVCDLAFGVINCKCANVKLPPFPGEVKLSKKFFAPPEKLVPNTKVYIPDKFDFNPHRVPVAVEMDIDHPTVKARHVVAAETPMNKRSRKKFTGKQKTKSSESNHEEAADLEPEAAPDNWIDDLPGPEDNDDDDDNDGDNDGDVNDVVMMEVENVNNNKKSDQPEKTAVDEGHAEVIEEALPVDEGKKGRASRAKKVKENDAKEKVVKEKTVKLKAVKLKAVKENVVKETVVKEKNTKRKVFKRKVVKEKASKVNVKETLEETSTEAPVESGEESQVESEDESPKETPVMRTAVITPKLVKTSKKPTLVVKKQSVCRTELFPEPELPKPKPIKDFGKPQKVMKIKIAKKGHSKEAIKKSFNSMYDQLIKNSYDPMPYYKRKSPSPEREIKLPEKRLTLVSTRHQKKIGLDKVDLGQSPAVTLLASTPATGENRKKRKPNDIRSFLTPNDSSTPVVRKAKKTVIKTVLLEESDKTAVVLQTKKGKSKPMTLVKPTVNSTEVKELCPEDGEPVSEVLTPKVLTPEVLTAEVLTPDVLTAEVLTPEVLTAEVLTPEVLTPEVLTPEVLTPEVLSPEAMTSEVSTPEVLTPEDKELSSESECSSQQDSVPAAGVLEGVASFDNVPGVEGVSYYEDAAVTEGAQAVEPISIIEESFVSKEATDKIEVVVGKDENEMFEAVPIGDIIKYMPIEEVSETVPMEEEVSETVLIGDVESIYSDEDVEKVSLKDVCEEDLPVADVLENKESQELPCTDLDSQEVASPPTDDLVPEREIESQEIESGDLERSPIDISCNTNELFINNKTDEKKPELKRVAKLISPVLSKMRGKQKKALLPSIIVDEVDESDIDDVEEEDDDGIPLLPVGEDSDDSEEEELLEFPRPKRIVVDKGRRTKTVQKKADVDVKVTKKPAKSTKKPNPVQKSTKKNSKKTVAKKTAPVPHASKSTAKNLHPVTNIKLSPKVINKKVTKFHPGSKSKESNKMVAPRNPRKPPPVANFEAAIISEFTEEEPSFTVEEEIVTDRKRKRKIEKENDRAAAANKSTKNKIINDRERITSKTKKNHQSEKSTISAPQTSQENNSLRMPAITEDLSSHTQVVSQERSIIASMDELEPEIRIKRRKTLRRT